MKINVVTKTNQPIKSFEFNESENPNLIQMVSKVVKKNPNRVRLTVKGQSITSLSDITSLCDSDTVNVVYKDLGLQISWKLVFVLEYLGPFLIHYFYYSQLSQPLHYHTRSVWLIFIHYLKRELETLFIHRFSNSTMPILNLPKNCFHYWVLGGLIQFGVYSTHSNVNSKFDTLFLVGWTISQLLNLVTHTQLRNLRPHGSTVRKLPQGLLFKYITTPNYTFEILSWFFYFGLVGWHWSVGLFWVVGSVQMYLWSKKKRSRYIKEFGKGGKKACLIPFLL